MNEPSFKDDHGLIQDPRAPTFFTIGRPRDHKAKICIWADLTVNDLDVISECATNEQIRQVLTRRFGLNEQNPKHRILLDLYLSSVQFAREKHFSSEQTSAFFSIVKRTHEVAVETPFGNVDQTFNYFREQVLCHAVHRPPFSLGLFNSEEVESIMKYVLDTYFCHFKLYKFAFTPQVRLDLSITYEGMPPETPVEDRNDIPGREDSDETFPVEDDPVSARGDENAADSESLPLATEDTPAMKQLRDLVRSHVSAELKHLRTEMDEKLRLSENQLIDRLAAGEGGRKSAKGSAKGRKK